MAANMLGFVEQWARLRSLIFNAWVLVNAQLASFLKLRDGSADR